MQETIPGSRLEKPIKAVQEAYRNNLKKKYYVDSVVPKLRDSRELTINGTHCPERTATPEQIAAVELAERVARKFAYRMVEWAEDVMQEARYCGIYCCEKYLERAQHDPVKFKNTVITVTKNRMVDFMNSIKAVTIPARSFTRGVHEILGYDKEEGVQITAISDNSAVTSEHPAMGEESLIAEVFANLEGDELQIAQLKYLGKTITEIAEELDKSVGYVHKHLKMAQRRVFQ